MSDVILKTFELVFDFLFYAFGNNSASMHCDLILAVCSALACVACIRLFWMLLD